MFTGERSVVNLLVSFREVTIKKSGDVTATRPSLGHKGISEVAGEVSSRRKIE